ncbi:aa3-type cytochrome c oxidase subunit IV [Leptolyngbya sp. 15MV]|nr:aa3-type cytochrome c oxidase subunit IV [Leptolyngbya sp. 15MV]
MGSANDMKAAEKTYGGFITLLKWSVPVIALVTLLVIILIAP